MKPEHIVTIAKAAPPRLRMKGTRPVPSTCMNAPEAIARVYSTAGASTSPSAPRSRSSGTAKASTSAMSSALAAMSSSTAPEKQRTLSRSCPCERSIVKRIAPARPIPVPTAEKKAATG